MLFYKEYVLSPQKDWVVFIHGAGGSSSIWYKQLREFKKHFNLLLVDLRGHGKSKSFLQEYMQNKYTFKAIAQDVIEVLDHVGIQQAHFVSISLGSIIVRTIGEIQPHRIKSMILGGAIIRLNIRSNILMRLGNWVKQFVPYMWIYKFFAWVIMPRKRHKKSRLMFINEAKKLYQKEFLRWYHLTSEVNPLLRYFNEKELPIPALYIMGDEDYMFLPQVKHLVKKHKYAQLIILPDCGHVVNIDQAELFNQKAIEFLQQH
ncbi:MAG: alpha/beta hydrolase [Microscillaceae bacterium]|nr:alpha/beta hydrolase [Microscillaceae bacterium]MDW8459735.1 alpha/beta hydrolase [Cytophagales bacterium]